MRRGERGVEDVADDAARERQPVAARLALLLEHALADEPVDGVVEIPVALGERLEVLRVEGLAETEATERRSRSSSGSRSIRFSTACWMVAGSASAEISASFEKLQAPVSSSRDPARLDERADELPA